MKLEFGDMVFYSAVGLVVILLFWLRFVEAHLDLWGAWIVWGAWTALLVRAHVRSRRPGPHAAKRAPRGNPMTGNARE